MTGNWRLKVCALSRPISPCLWRKHEHVPCCLERGPLYGSWPPGPEMHQLLSAPPPPTSHDLGTQPGCPGSSAFLSVSHIVAPSGTSEFRDHAATISHHSPQNSAHRQHLPNTQMVPHKPSQEDFSLPVPLTSWGAVVCPWPISSCHSGSFPSGHSLGPSAPTLPVPRAWCFQAGRLLFRSMVMAKGGDVVLGIMKTANHPECIWVEAGCSPGLVKDTWCFCNSVVQTPAAAHCRALLDIKKQGGRNNPKVPIGSSRTQCLPGRSNCAKSRRGAGKWTSGHAVSPSPVDTMVINPSPGGSWGRGSQESE